MSYRIYSGKDRQREVYESLREWVSRLVSFNRYRIARGIEPPEHLRIPSRGFCTISNDNFTQIPDIVDRARRYSDNLDPAEAEDTSTKQHLLYPHLPQDELSVSSAFLNFALDENLIAAVTDYLGTIPILYRVSLMYSRYVPESPYESSQLYHCDWDAVSQVKVFVHVNDVAPKNGPLVVVDANESKEVRRKLGYVYRSRKSRKGMYAGPRLTDRQVEANVNKHSIHTILGPSGTISIIDTSRCLHYGSRIEPGQPPRTIVLFWYLKRSSFRFSLLSSKGFPYRAIDGELSEIQKMVLGKK